MGLRATFTFLPNRSRKLVHWHILPKQHELQSAHGNKTFTEIQIFHSVKNCIFSHIILLIYEGQSLQFLCLPEISVPLLTLNSFSMLASTASSLLSSKAVMTGSSLDKDR